MKSLIITVAGLSSRFNKDLEKPVLKCLYYEDNHWCSLLTMQISRTYELVDEIVIVGGYKYDDLTTFITEHIKDTDNKIKTVFNEHYHDYGSGYSLLKGIDALSKNTDEVTFIEGDLFFDTESVETIIESRKDVISVNNEPILSNKAVALYFDATYHPHYIYDTSHSCLEIHEPFTAIYNSGQMWKFSNPTKLKIVCSELTKKQIEGTNLEIVQRYYGDIDYENLEIVRVEKWYNCNTVNDYREAVKNII
ncbi:MAG: NTP transferase domain-containing protein [bacterium]|nr:NTP transferase domain-containing protein [Candidatus Limimorpha caballi]